MSEEAFVQRAIRRLTRPPLPEGIRECAILDGKERLVGWAWCTVGWALSFSVSMELTDGEVLVDAGVRFTFDHKNNMFTTPTALDRLVEHQRRIHVNHTVVRLTDLQGRPV